MNGHLQTNPPAEIVREILLENLSGALRLVREPIKAVVYFNSGEAVYAGSNVRALRLSECARRWKIIPAEKQSLIEAQMSLPDRDFGKLLVAEKIISPDELPRLFQRQATEAFCHVLSLNGQGEWRFDSRARLGEEAWTKFDAEKFLIEHARRVPSEFIRARLAETNEIISPTERQPNLDLLPSEAFVLSRADAPLRLSDLISISGLTEDEAKRTIYSLALGGYVRRENARIDFSNAPAVARTTIAASNVPKQDELKVAAESAKEADKKFSSEQPKEETPNREAELEELFKRAGRTNYYEIIGVGQSVTPQNLKRAYYALAKRFHPDRFHKEATPDLRSRVESAFASIAQAYETLSNLKSRAAYDLKLSAMKQTADASPQAASSSRTPEATPANNTPSSFSSYVTDAEKRSASESRQDSAAARAAESFSIGTAALEQGNYVLAAMRCGDAARLVPGEARYRAQYGRALARDPKTRRMAEAEFLAAVDLDKRNAKYRVLLAEFYQEVGLKRRAEGELERALQIDPQDAGARRLLNELRAA
jgi:curved DNA-binding protein CbpA